jgi:TonB-dependent SusC/RagA subfamily outer membrane receptor
MKKIHIFILLIFVITRFTNAQDKVVHGVVHTFDSIPLIGAKVISKSTKQTVLTDSLGSFSLATESGDKLRIRAEGFFNQNVKVDEKTKFVAVNMRLKPGDKQREYAIGYGYVSEEDLTAAVNQFSTSQNDFSRYNDMFELIRGRFPGVDIQNGEIVMRGTKTFQGSDAALIILDGVVADSEILRSLSPMDVKSVNVIKDGSTAVYGSRGANGVLLIETKKGGDD